MSLDRFTEIHQAGMIVQEFNEKRNNEFETDVAPNFFAFNPLARALKVLAASSDQSLGVGSYDLAFFDLLRAKAQVHTPSCPLPCRHHD
jgi:hypothetical protein